jgi:hypothetical protein
MPSRKQRRRREKTMRHEYDYVLLDDDGNEVPLDPAELRAEREAKEKERAASRPTRGSSTGSNGRPLRVPPEPSWDRALRRGGLMGGLMLVVFVFLFKNSAPLVMRLAWGLFYAGAFVPLTYFVDRMAYRTYERRVAKTGAKKPAAGSS